VHPSDSWTKQAQAIFTAGEDGKVKAWQISSEPSYDGAQMQASQIERPRKKKKKESTDDGDGKGRFKPY